MNGQTPLVSIGLPIYNGENYVAQAIESVLAQTYTNFELIISDNASTDATQAICKEYAAKDERIRYHRNAKNVGAGPNFNVAFELARGKYFQWLAHDDLIAPGFLEKSVAVLENDSSVVLCSSNVAVIDEASQPIDQFEIALKTDSPNPAQRYRALLLDWHERFDIFGLIRTDVLKQTPAMGNYTHGDSVLLSRLSLFGRFHKIEEFLFYSRRHALQSAQRFYSATSNSFDSRAYNEWFDTAKKSKLNMPWWRILWEYGVAIWQTPTSFVAKLLCHLYLLRYLIRIRSGLLRDLVFAARYMFSCFPRPKKTFSSSVRTSQIQ